MVKTSYVAAVATRVVVGLMVVGVAAVFIRRWWLEEDTKP